MKSFYFLLLGLVSVAAFVIVLSQNSGRWGELPCKGAPRGEVMAHRDAVEQINKSSIDDPTIDKEDRKILEPFFKTLLIRQALGYVLLGEKPAIRLGYIHHLSWKYPFSSLSSSYYFDKRNQSQKKAWEVWKKYSHKLSDRFLFTEEVNFRSPLCVEVFIIHRERFCRVVDDNRGLFEEILKRKITGKVLYEEAKQKPLFSVLLEKNEALLGIILGYGKVNSILFAEGKKVGTEIFPKKEDEISSVSLPIFRAKWDDPETIQLRERYLACREQIQKTFLDHNTFDQMLKILFDEMPIAEPMGKP